MCQLYLLNTPISNNSLVVKLLAVKVTEIGRIEGSCNKVWYRFNTVRCSREKDERTVCQSHLDPLNFKLVWSHLEECLNVVMGK